MRILEKLKKRVYFHKQALDPDGYLWRYGRVWFHLGIENDYPGVFIEWCLPSRFCHIKMCVDLDEGQISFGVAIPPISLWWGFTNLWKILNEFGPWEEEGWLSYKRDLAISFHDSVIYWTLWKDAFHWTSKIPRWRQGAFRIVDFFCGQKEHFEKVVRGPEIVSIPMPERTYRCSIEMKKETWKRARLPWTSDRVVRAHVDMHDDPIPHPHKNGGEDATYAMMMPAENIPDAIGKLVGFVMSRRERHGSLDWRPEERC